MLDSNLYVMLFGRSSETEMEDWPSQESTQAAAFNPLTLFLAKTFFKLCCETLSGTDKSMTVTEDGILMWILMFQSFLGTYDCWELKWALSGSEIRIYTKAKVWIFLQWAH